MTLAALLLLLATAAAESPVPSPAPAGPSVAIGPLVLTPTTVDAKLFRIDPGELHLQTCLQTTQPTPPTPAAPQVADGQIQLQVTIRRGQVKVVTTTSVSQGLEWMTPCLERRLAAWQWPDRTAEVQVPLTVTAEEAPAPPAE